MIRRSMLAMLITTPLRLRTLGWSTCLRLKARSRWVRAPALAAVVAINSTSLRSGLDGSRRDSTTWLRPSMTVSRLLKSWAMPPASWPTTSIFWA